MATVTTSARGPAISVEELSFEKTNRGQRLSHLTIGGAYFHVEAIEVLKKDPSTAVNRELQNRIDAVKDVDGGYSTDYQLVTIENRPHFVLIYPFQA